MMAQHMTNQTVMRRLEQSLLQLQWSMSAMREVMEAVQERQSHLLYSNGVRLGQLTQAIMDIHRRIAAPQQVPLQPSQPGFPEANPPVRGRAVSVPQVLMVPSSLRRGALAANINVRETNRRIISENLPGVLDITLSPLMNVNTGAPITPFPENWKDILELDDAGLRTILAQLGITLPELTTDMCRTVLFDEIF